MAHWSSQYVGRPYIEGVFDCAELARIVQREVFHREVNIPSDRDYSDKQGAMKFLHMRRQLERCTADAATPTETPEEGDAVLLNSRGFYQHIGVYCVVNGEPQVLHATDRADQVVLTKVRELHIRGYRVGGYFKWN